MAISRRRLYLDEDVLGLRPDFQMRGYEVFDAKGEGLLHQSDGAQLVRATLQDAILISRNRYDYEILVGGWRALGIDFPGIISFQGPPGWASLATQAELIDHRLREVGVAAFRNSMHIWEVARGRWRIQDGRQKPPRRR